MGDEMDLRRGGQHRIPGRLRHGQPDRHAPRRPAATPRSCRPANSPVPASTWSDRRAAPTTTRSSACSPSSTMRPCRARPPPWPPATRSTTTCGQALLRRGLPLPRPFDRSAWRFDAGNRPPADSDGYRPPVKLAVLLPMSGNLAVAATPVRDGFLAGYYGEARRRPDVSFYDTAGAGGALAAYDQAAAEGNDFVVGPLGRDEVNALFAKGALPVPVLALNRGDASPPQRQRQLLAVAGRRRHRRSRIPAGPRRAPRAGDRRRRRHPATCGRRACASAWANAVARSPT